MKIVVKDSRTDLPGNATLVVEYTDKGIVLSSKEPNSRVPLTPEPVSQFLSDVGQYVEGQFVLYAECYDRFIAWLPRDERRKWTKPRFTKNLPSSHPTVCRTGNKKYVSNLSWKDTA